MRNPLQFYAFLYVRNRSHWRFDSDALARMAIYLDLCRLEQTIESVQVTIEGKKMRDNYSLLIEKLDDFIRKYYVNQLLRGALYSVAAILGMFILLNVMEYYFYFSTGVRKVLFYGFIGGSAVALWRWVGLPLGHYYHLGKVIGHEQAATIIGQHFTEVKDKLLNILQLRQQGANALHSDLIMASVNQKSEEIKFVPFKSAIDLGKNRKYLRYALPPVLALLFLIFGAPNILREGTLRLLKNNEVFEKPAPFKFKVRNADMTAVQFSDFTLDLEVEGDVLPNDVFIDLGAGVQYRLTKDAANQFSYTFSNIQKDVDFKLFAGEVESKPMQIEVLKKPGIAGFDVKLRYPEYIGRPAETLANVGDLVVPQGTNLSWVFQAQNTEQLSIKFGTGSLTEANRMDEQNYGINHRAMQDEPYRIFISNRFVPNGDSVSYVIQVVPDLAPQIAVQEFKDSTNQKALFFAGDASDDYGLSNLTFNYQIKRAATGQLPMQQVKVGKKDGKQTDYTYTWDISQLELLPGDEITYFFEVFDNDGVNGAKSARTGVGVYKLPTVDEMEKQVAKNADELTKDLKDALKESLKIQEELKRLRDKVLQQKEMDWQTKKEMEKLMQRQNEVNQMMQDAKKALDQNMEQEKQMQKQSEEMKEQYEKLQDMMEKAMNPEMQKLMEEIQKLMQEMNKDQALDKMEKMQTDNKEMSKDLEKMQELFKNLEVENLAEKQVEKMEELAKKEEKLAEDTEKKAKSEEELKKEQDEIKKELEDWKKKQEELEKKNEDLKKPKDLPKDMDKDADDAKEDMEKSKEELDKKDSPSASKSQKKAAKKMKNMANKMSGAMAAAKEKQIEEDVKTLRQILENLVGLSFTQEQTMLDVSKTRINTPPYLQLVQSQFKLKDDFQLVEDSLHALGQRNLNIESLITEKVGEVREAIKKSVDQLEERQTTVATEQQQRSFKGMNDLALLLSDALNNMQQNPSNSQGSGSCKKPGGGKSKEGNEPKDKMSKGQKDVNGMMKELKERLDKQKQDGASGGSGGSKELAQMAAKQAALRNALRQMQKEKEEQGKGLKILDEVMQEMDKVETDLVNKRLTNETLKRQEQILTRLLEEERAEREREQDEKREAQSATQQQPRNPASLDEYLKKRQSETELYKTVSPTLKPFYKQLVEQYWKGQ
jgi:Domain of unknown function (DUF4175)